MAAILDFTWLPWLQAKNPVLLRLETFLVTLALILIFFRHVTVSSKYANKVQPTWI